MKKIKGFTLAEVLITLTILGVVAAITVPTLQKQNYKRTQVTRMAKAYAVLENAATNIAKNTNCVGKDIKCTGLFDITDDNKFKEKFIELGEFNVNQKVQLDGAYIYLKNLQYKKELHQNGYYNFFMTTPDRMVYIPVRASVRKSEAVSEPAILIRVVTDKVKLYDENGNLKTGALNTTDAIQGRNTFQFVIYGNFIVEPMMRCGGFWPMSRIGRGINKWAVKDELIYKCCDPDNYVGGDYNDSCTVRIIKDGWKMKY